MNKELQKLPPFAEEVMSNLLRFDECANDFEADGVDIGRDWLDTLTHLGVLERVQRSPAMWQTTPEGDALLEAYSPPAAMDESNFAPRGWKIERTPDGGFCLSHPTHGRGFFSDKGHKPAVVVSRFLDALLTYGPTAERLQAENAALQQRLNTADQRVDELTTERDTLKAEVDRLKSTCKGFVDLHAQAQSELATAIAWLKHAKPLLHSGGFNLAASDIGNFLSDQSAPADKEVLHDWIKWDGGGCPVDSNAMVEYVLSGYPARVSLSLAGVLDWRSHTKATLKRSNIAKYRIAPAAKGEGDE